MITPEEYEKFFNIMNLFGLADAGIKDRMLQDTRELYHCILGFDDCLEIALQEVKGLNDIAIKELLQKSRELRNRIYPIYFALKQLQPEESR